MGTDGTDPANLITIFGPEDQNPDPGGLSNVDQVAVIDFNSGKVFDVDDPNFAVDPLLAVQDTFTGTGDIGFFLKIDPSLVDLTLFSEASLNSSGLDAVATFPFLSDPQNYWLGFEEPINEVFLGFNVIGGVDPIPIPEPATIMLLGSSLASLAVYRKRINKH
jgi:hypothetical protein